MIGLWHRLIHLLPGPFRARHGGEFAFYLEHEIRRLDGATWSERAGFFARIGRDFASTFQREWRRALPLEIQLALAGVGALIGLEISSANFFAVGGWLLMTSAFFVVQWIALQSSAVSKARLAVWTVSYLMAGSLLPGILVWLPSAAPPRSPCEMIDSAVMVTLLVDYLRNAEWVDTPVSRRHKKRRFSKSVGLTLLALWPLLATIAWGRPCICTLYGDSP